ncbi:hypothetical protein [Marinoscillum furvescens]|uniref:DKNYY family protein n=1 Tax=Marinoscillum furvescens DSM 4134 TaxID=1122208 RepID=A0A3D9L2T3_MARFU|nr:hypothetical protein [Marinoscillum furvescens]RED99426.1 hypothetical protein C7460_10842 [Marinoscillum furvescens DSM 4134]
MKTLKQLTCLLGVGLSSIACTNAPISQPEYINGDWAKTELWDDGKAEVAIYDATRVIYGKPRTFDYVYVLVKESFNKAYQVKTDDYNRDDLYEVMKVNKFCRIPTQAYPYHFLTSVFFRRESPSTVHKLTNTSQEWCGNTAKSFTEGQFKYNYQYMSYWDGQGNGSMNVTKGPWFEDQLSYTLRTLKFADGLQFDIEMYPSEVNSKATEPIASTCSISVNRVPFEWPKQEVLEVKEAWKVDVKRSNGPNLSYWYSTDYPNYLLKMESTDGRSLSLKDLSRDAYWAHE